jgi:hypothetical protein
MKTTNRKSPSSSHSRALSPAEIRPLIMAAREAWIFQGSAIPFDDFRWENVMDAVGKSGLSTAGHEDFCKLMGHFKMAAGKDEEAFEWFFKDGKNSERQVAWKIADTLAKHLWLAHSTPEQITAATTSSRLRKGLLTRKAALQDHPEGPFGFESLQTVIRGKISQPSFQLGTDIAASLVTKIQLRDLLGILFTLRNRISEREGRGLIADRNKSQKESRPAPKAEPTRSTGSNFA